MRKPLKLKIISIRNTNTKKKLKILAYSNITTGGLSVRGTKEQLEDVVDFVSKKGFRHEVTFEHPTKVTKRIIESFKSKN